MKNSELKEAAAILRSLLPALTAAAADQSGEPGASLRQAVGSLAARAEAAISQATAISDLGDCMVYALNAGVDFAGFGRMRSVALDMRASGWPGVVVLTSFIQLTLIWQAYLVASTEFVSREQVDSYRVQLNAGFDAAELAASDLGDHIAYRALLAVHGAAIRDLSARARPLPQIVPYQLPVRQPSLWLANRLYGDAGRADELARENRAVHPLFMPASGRALSA